MKCNVCNKYKARWKDYRFIESCGFQGKTYVCDWCRELDDVAISQIVRDKLNPKDFYDKPKNRKIRYETRRPTPTN